jgi:heme-degrading monooxygenase HmoA
MIARTWNGKTSIARYEDYTAFLKQVAIPDYQKTPGFKGLSFLRRVKDGEGHFTLITYWENVEAIKAFAGQDIEKPKYYPEDDRYLLEFEAQVAHFEVFAPGNDESGT